MNDSVETLDDAKVFVVHGRNEQVRGDVFDFLRALHLKPIEWSQAVKMTGKGAPAISDVLDTAFGKARAVVVLLTGDDEVRLREKYRTVGDEQEAALTPQARPNVLFEAGMAFAYHPDRTILVQLGELREFSDIAGRHTIRLNNSAATRHELAQRLTTAGCNVDTSGADWLNVGDFDVPTGLSGKKPADAGKVSDSGSAMLAQDAVQILRQIGQKTQWSELQFLQTRSTMHAHRFNHFTQILDDVGYIKRAEGKAILTQKGRTYLVNRNLI